MTTVPSQQNTTTTQVGERSAEVLTLAESAVILRCSRAHVSNLIHGRVGNTTRLRYLRLGRRVLIRREWLDRWMEENVQR